MIDETLDNDLDALLDQEEPQQKKQSFLDLLPSKIRITEGAYDIADRIGPIVKELTSRDLEWSAVLLADKGDTEYTIRDIFLQQGQKIDHGNVVINGDDIAKANAAVGEANKQRNLNRYIIGWIHGHGLAALIPSGTDKENFITVMNSTTLNTEQRMLIPFNLIESEQKKKWNESTLTFTGEAIEDGSIECIAPSVQTLEQIAQEHALQGRNLKPNLIRRIIEETKLNLYQPVAVGFCYFVIMNNRHDEPYASLGILQENVFSKEKSYKLVKRGDLEIVTAENDVVISTRLLKKMVKAATGMPRKKRFYFGSHTIHTSKYPNVPTNYRYYPSTIPAGTAGYSVPTELPSFNNYAGHSTAFDIIAQKATQHETEKNKAEMHAIRTLCALGSMIIKDINYDFNMRRQWIDDYFKNQHYSLNPSSVGVEPAQNQLEKDSTEDDDSTDITLL